MVFVSLPPRARSTREKTGHKGRKTVTLPQVDVAFLEERALQHHVEVDGGMTCVLISSWRLPSRYSRSETDLMIRLSPGYPDVAPDMWWFNPAIYRADGTELPNTNVFENYLGHRWQRWSRHFSSSQWRSGVDSLESYLALIRQHLTDSVPEFVT